MLIIGFVKIKSVVGELTELFILSSVVRLPIVSAFRCCNNALNIVRLSHCLRCKVRIGLLNNH